MSDALREMTLTALDSYETFLLEHAKHDTQVEDAQVRPACTTLTLTSALALTLTLTLP